MALFGQTRAVVKMQKLWGDTWRSPEAAAPPRPGIDPDKALWNLANLANAGGATTGDSLVIALEVVTGVDRHKSYPDAMEDVRGFYARGQLRTTDDRPLERYVTWGGVVEIAEAACLLARPMKVQGWVNEQAFAAGRGEPHELARCAELALLTTVDVAGYWRRVLAETERAGPDGDDDYIEKVTWVRRMLDTMREIGV